MTLEEIGERLDVTRERVRQIEAKVFQRLKHPTRIDWLLHELGVAPFKQPEQNTQAPPERQKGVEPLAVDTLLDQIRNAGFSVEDYLEGDVRRLWVYIVNAPDNRSRKIVRKLIALGFEFWPGKGYWR